MTSAKKVARRKLSLPELASELDNVSKVCRIMGYPRQQHCEIRHNYRTFGAGRLADRLPVPRAPHPNRVGEATAKRILAYSLEFPTHGPVRVPLQLAPQDAQVSSWGQLGVWSRSRVFARHERLMYTWSGLYKIQESS